MPMCIYAGSDSKPVVFDSEFTLAVTRCAIDFEGLITPVDKYTNGIGAIAKVIGEGIIVWKFRDKYRVEKHIRVNTYHVPASKVRLFSSQQYFRQERAGLFKISMDCAIFTFATGSTLTFTYYDRTLLLIADATPKPPSPISMVFLSSTGRNNISKAHEELILWYLVFGCYNINNTQKMMRAQGLEEDPIIIVKEPRTAIYNIPYCQSCLGGKASQTSVQNKHINPNTEHSNVIKTGDLLPGGTVSIDQYDCRIKFRLSHTKGKEDPHKMWYGGTFL